MVPCVRGRETWVSMKTEISLLTKSLSQGTGWHKVAWLIGYLMRTVKEKYHFMKSEACAPKIAEDDL